MDITLEIQRFDPRTDGEPYFQTYRAQAELEDRLLTVLMAVKRLQDPTLGFRKSCAHGVCGSDAMVVNGKERLACKTLIKDVVSDDGAPIRIEPLLTLPVQRDLMVDQDPFLEKYAEAKPFFISHTDPPEKERLQSQGDRERFDDQTNCILCASCYSTCPVVREKKTDWLGPAAVVNAARFIEDSRDEGYEDRLPTLDAPDGVWPCDNHYECTRQCPRGIKITKHINETKRRIREHSKEGEEMATEKQRTWVCGVCGYVHEGPEPPETCPQCGAAAEVFEPGEEQASEPAPQPEAKAGAASANKVWVCGVCGYVHGGPEPPETCPQCGAAAEAFEAGEETAASGGKPEPPDSPTAWICTVCGYVHEGPEPPESCPQCGAPASAFEPYQEPEKHEEDTAPDVERESGPRTISEVMVDTMVNWGVTHVFGIVGHSNLGLANAIRQRVKTGDLEFISVRHEGSGAFAASAYAKLTGRPAACLSIAGPGATNLLTGLWDAKVDRAPILALTGQVETQVLGPGAFQEIDLASAFRPVANWSQTVLASSNHAELMTLALKHATLNRDVGHLIFPNEVQTLPADSDAKASGPEGRLTPLEITPPAESVDKALELLKGAKRPAIIVGHGSRFRMGDILPLAEALNAPVITTFKAKGLIPDAHPLACGVLGLSGTPVSNHFMRSADVLLVFGASFSHHTGISPNIPTIQVDFDPAILGKFHPVKAPVYGEIGITARLLSKGLDKTNEQWEDRHTEIAEQWKAWREEKARRADTDRGHGLSSAAVFAAMSDLVPEDAVIAVDVGNNTYSFGRYFESKRQSVVMSGYLGSIGFGYPAAMGACAAAPDRPVVAVTGDGGFAQYMGELCTAVQHGMNITHILLNNSALGKIADEQRREHFEVWATSLHNPSFADYAENCGAKGIRVANKAELEPALETALTHDGPALVEVLTDPELV